MQVLCRRLRKRTADGRYVEEGVNVESRVVRMCFECCGDRKREAPGYREEGIKVREGRSVSAGRFWRSIRITQMLGHI